MMHLMVVVKRVDKMIIRVISVVDKAKMVIMIIIIIRVRRNPWISSG